MVNASDGTGRSTATAAFKRTTPPAMQRAARSPTTLQALSKLEQRSQAIKERALAHHKNFEDRWTAKEAIRIWQRHLAQTASHPIPKGVDRTVMPEGISKMASQNVQARTHRRLARINAIKVRMGNSILRNLAQPSPRLAFNQAGPGDTPARKQTLKR